MRPETFKHLHTPLFGGDYAFGWIVVDRSRAGGRAFKHAGTNNQNVANAWIAPVKDFALLVMTNQAGGGAFKTCDTALSVLIPRFVKGN